jgi:SAM-dependent methyltransferase
MSFDAGAYRDTSLRDWEEAAPGWARRQRDIAALFEPVTHWMIDALELQPGERVLELAAGIGEPGMLAAELVAPAGGVIVSDQAEAMLDAARERAAQLGLDNVEFRVLNAEWIDLPVATIDAVLCRMGYMLMADPAAALAETRRVLRTGGRLALAVWDAAEENPWMTLPGRVLAERGHTKPSAPGEPGPFALGNEQTLTDLLYEAGFREVRIERVDVSRRHASFAEYWSSSLELSRAFHDAVMSQPQPEIEQIEAAVERKVEPYTADDGSLELPGRALLAAASV